MYIPSHFINKDKPEILEFMRAYSFATIVTAKENIPVATHLPFVIEESGDDIILTSHFAKANKQANDITEGKVLVIFSEPHAYISPKHYESKQNVPTWNYISVHVYGTGEIIESDSGKFDVLEKMIRFYEQEYEEQWDSLSSDYKDKMIKGIVAFKIVVDEIQGKKKLSQNKMDSEKDKIIKTFKHSNDQNENLIAEYMERMNGENQNS